MLDAEMSGDALIFEGSKKKAALLLFLAVCFVALGLYAIAEGKWFGWLVTCFFGLGIPVAIFMLMPGATYLKLDKSGIEMKTMFKPLKLHWNDVEGFYIGRIYSNRMIGISYSKSYQASQHGRKLASALSGMEGAIPDHFKSSPEEVCEKLNLWKKRFGRSS